MADKTGIQWTDATWNPLAAYDRETGKRGWFCTKVSPGCKNCYAAVINKRLGNRHDYTVPNLPKVEWRLVNLDQPIRWKRPRRIFVNSMTDLFHEDVPDEMIAAVFDAMRAAPQHTFQVLTKRAERMASVARRLRWDGRGDGRTWIADSDAASGYRLMGGNGCTGLQNVWLGVSVEGQQRADERIPHLVQTAAAVRFLSCEPLLGPLDLSRWIRPDEVGRICFSGTAGYALGSPVVIGMDLIQWIIVGGESGKHARPFDVAWAESLIDQCRDAHAAVFCKQLGSAWAKAVGADSHGGDPIFWPEHLRVREFPKVAPIRAPNCTRIAGGRQAWGGR